MEIKLVRLELENFKGIRKFVFEPEGKNAEVRGQNASGKTTLADAFRWLLMGKDTQDKADFAIKTLDPTGQEQSGLDHTVKALIEVDGTPVKLKRTYKEKWTKRRGESKKTLTGHNTLFTIDGVPTTKKEWDRRMADLINEDTFKLLTLPTFFNSLHWQKRREILLEVCGNISDDSVIASDSDLYQLTDILKDRSLEDHQRVIKAEKAKINESLKAIPYRIDELHKSLPEAGNRKAIEAFLKHLEHKLQQIKDDSNLSALRKELADKSAELGEIQATERIKELQANEETDNKIADLKKQIREINLLESEEALLTAQESIEKNNNAMGQLRNSFAAVSARKPEYDEICPACNQSIPEDQIEKVKAKFNENQANELARINSAGKELKAKNAELIELATEIQKRIGKDKDQIAVLEKHIEGLEKQKVPEMGTVPAIEKLTTDITNLEAAINNYDAPDTAELEVELEVERAKLAALDAAESTKKRIEELKSEEKDLAVKFEEIERQLFMMEQFIVQKVSLLEDKINSKFDLARFKLFDTQINEGIKETCITTVNGVPYGSGLNKGAEINVGLDIIKTLSDHYEIKAPIWIDNAEAVTDLLETDSQTFKLIVSADHPEMEVKYG